MLGQRQKGGSGYKGGKGCRAEGARKLRASDAAGNKKVQGYLARATPKQEASTLWRVLHGCWTNEGSARSGNKALAALPGATAAAIHCEKNKRTAYI